MLIIGLLASFTICAYDFEVNGIYYNIISMSDLEVEVTHSSQQNVSEYYKNSSYTGDIVIPETVNYNNRTFLVTKVGDYAFGGGSLYKKGCTVTNVILPKSVREIGSRAFAFCDYLYNIELPDQLRTIGGSAFYKCPLLSIRIPDNVETIGGSAFLECSNLHQVILGKGLKSIGVDAFYRCSNLWEIFFLSSTPPSMGLYDSYSGAYGERYVPSRKVYGFGKEYVAFATDSYEYSGGSHPIQWTNNLKAYKCSISEDECVTDVNAGSYIKILKATYSDGIDITVDIPFEYVINKAPLSLVVNNAQREYGDQNPDFTCEISGFVNDESISSIGSTPHYECEATQNSNVGDYRILASLAAPNYEISYTYGKLSVLKAPLNITVANATKVYGNTNPDFSLTFSGLKNGENAPVWKTKPQISTTATKSSGVGVYPITVAAADPMNYNIIQNTPGELTVTKRDLTAKANDCERQYGDENPQFSLTYIGFVNGDNESDLGSMPVTNCLATKDSDAGKYPITVTGGEADNYNFLYQDGILTVKPLAVGFKNVYNSVTYNDMSVSTDDRYFNYLPEITGPFSQDDFWIELWYLDKDNIWAGHDYVATITSGEYAGNYINTNYDRIMWAGKYIFNLTPKGTNPNVVANPSRAYLTVKRASTNLQWDANSPITVGVGEKVNLGISYQADLWCMFDTDYDESIISLSSEGENTNNPAWYATGIKEGETTLYFSINCHKNDMGFYDFADSSTLSRRIKVVAGAGIDDVNDNADQVRVIARDGRIDVINKKPDAIVRVFSLQGHMIIETCESSIDHLPRDIYIVTVNGKSFKIAL